MDKEGVDNVNEEKLLSKFSGYTKNRLSNPFLFSYFISWLVCNWKFISFMLFSNLTIEKKLENFNEYINILDWMFPLFGVFFYLFLLTPLEAIIVRFSRNGFKFRVYEVEKSEMIKLESEVKIARKRVELINQKFSSDQLEKLVKVADTLEIENKKLREEIAELKEVKHSETSSTPSVALTQSFTTPTVVSLLIPEAKNVADSLRKMGMRDSFLNYVKKVNIKNYMVTGLIGLDLQNNESIFIDMNLINPIDKSVTDFGYEVFRILNKEQSFF